MVYRNSSKLEKRKLNKQLMDIIDTYSENLKNKKIAEKSSTAKEYNQAKTYKRPND